MKQLSFWIETLAFWRPSYWKMLLGNREYSGYRHWITECVCVRLLMAGAATLVVISILHGWRHSFGDNSTYSVAIWIMFFVNSLFVILLAFGAGRNFERMCYRQNNKG